ncbi:hypothetical protein [Paraburkholderia sp. RAU2J]|uniref:hypothetical protein n=1 Tax=Paraburkholderia sp. RAU2J TaxID=1938810 RepID=UPI000EAF8FC2|nr:hypothetical protein [Paraburkholderia sp. RAU2J]
MNTALRFGSPQAPTQLEVREAHIADVACFAPSAVEVDAVIASLADAYIRTRMCDAESAHNRL